jgi:sulfur relay protein TusB/DsrH
MLVIVKSAPDTTDGKRGVKLARDMAADVVLLQNGVYFAQKERLEGFCGTAYVLDDDVRLRGLKNDEIEKDIRRLDYGSLVDLMAREDKVDGMF